MYRGEQIAQLRPKDRTDSDGFQHDRACLLIRGLLKRRRPRDAADPPASRHPSVRSRMIITYAPVQQRRRSLHATRGHRDCPHAGKAQDPEHMRNDPGRKREAVTTRLASGELHQLRPQTLTDVRTRVDNSQGNARGHGLS